MNHDLVKALSDPAAYPRPGPDVRVVHTHVSTVFLTGDRAYKVKKPVRLWGFLDQGTPERRRALCEEEVRLNRPLAPEVYLGVVPIVSRGGRVVVGGTGKPVEHAVEMVRFSDDATLASRVARGAASREEVEEVARTIASFHAEARRDAEVAHAGRPLVFARILRENVRSVRRLAPDPLPERLVAAAASRAAALLRANRDLLRRRAGAGTLVEGHGDLRAEHFVRFETESGLFWRVVDRIEFSLALRCVDPLSDAAFLAMDLAALGRRDLAEAFEAAYLAERPDPDAQALLPLFLAYRALVRASVDGIRSRLDALPDADRERAASSARRHLALAWLLSRWGLPPPLVVMVGPAGVGKSAVAEAIAPFLGAEVIRSDVVRKRLAGLDPHARPTPEDLPALYSGTLSFRTYMEMARGAERALRKGRAVILDATYLRRGSRDAPALLARRLGCPYAYLAVDCPPAETRARIERRTAAGGDPSDATWEVHQSQVSTIETFDAVEVPRALLWDGRAAPAESLAPLVEVLAR